MTAEHAWPLAFVALVVTLVLVAAGGRSDSRAAGEGSAVSWAGLAG